MLKLTQIGIPGVDNGAPTICYVNPEYISMMFRSFYYAAKQEKIWAFRGRSHPSEPMAEGHYPPVEATALLIGGQHLWVTQTPQQVFEEMEKLGTTKPMGFA